MRSATCSIHLLLLVVNVHADDEVERLVKAAGDPFDNTWDQVVMRAIRSGEPAQVQRLQPVLDVKTPVNL